MLAALLCGLAVAVVDDLEMDDEMVDDGGLTGLGVRSWLGRHTGLHSRLGHLGRVHWDEDEEDETDDVSDELVDSDASMNWRNRCNACHLTNPRRGVPMWDDEDSEIAEDSIRVGSRRRGGLPRIRGLRRRGGLLRIRGRRRCSFRCRRCLRRPWLCSRRLLRICKRRCPLL